MCARVVGATAGRGGDWESVRTAAELSSDAHFGDWAHARARFCAVQHRLYPVSVRMSRVCEHSVLARTRSHMTHPLTHHSRSSHWNRAATAAAAGAETAGGCYARAVHCLPRPRRRPSRSPSQGPRPQPRPLPLSVCGRRPCPLHPLERQDVGGRARPARALQLLRRGPQDQHHHRQGHRLCRLQDRRMFTCCVLELEFVVLSLFAKGLSRQHIRFSPLYVVRLQCFSIDRRDLCTFARYARFAYSWCSSALCLSARKLVALVCGVARRISI